MRYTKAIVEKVLRQPIPSKAAIKSQFGSDERKLRIRGGAKAMIAKRERRMGTRNPPAIGPSIPRCSIQPHAKAVTTKTRPNRILSSGVAHRMQVNHDLLIAGDFAIGKPSTAGLPIRPKLRTGMEEPDVAISEAGRVAMGDITIVAEREVTSSCWIAVECR